MELRKLLDTVCRLILGALFIFAGFVKLVDPVGAQIKLDDYFTAFNLPWLRFAALYLGTGMALVEFMLGVSVILNIYRIATKRAILFITIFFTGLTLYLAIENPVSDCGCFGEAIKLSNWDTFYKNVVLLVLSFLVLKLNIRTNYKREHTVKSLGGILVLFGLTVAICSYHRLPLLDFRPYAIGNSISSLMELPEGAKVDVYKSIYFYEKDGAVEEFTEENYPWQDSTWTFVDVKSELIEKGDEPLIHDFVLLHATEGDKVQEILESEKTVFLVSIRKTDKIGSRQRKKLQAIGEQLLREDRMTYFITNDQLEKLISLLPQGFNPENVLQADETLLKTIARPNASVIGLQNGTVIAKYNLKNIDEDVLTGDFLSKVLKRYRVSNSILKIVYLLLIFTALFVLLKITWRRIKN